MSRASAPTTDRDRPVNIVLGSTTHPVTTETDTFYRDYIIHENRELTGKLYELREELTAVRQERDELEEQADSNEAKNINLKQHVKNFRDQAELYREIANADHKFFREYMQEGRDSRLRAEGTHTSYWRNPSDRDGATALMALMLCLQLYFSVGMSFTLSMVMLATWVMRPVREDTSAQGERQRVEEQLATLIRLKNEKKAELTRLKQTLDIVGTAVDNLET